MARLKQRRAKKIKEGYWLYCDKCGDWEMVVSVIRGYNFYRAERRWSFRGSTGHMVKENIPNNEFLWSKRPKRRS
jgi:hypothetical protein